MFWCLLQEGFSAVMQVPRCVLRQAVCVRVSMFGLCKASRLRQLGLVFSQGSCAAGTAIKCTAILQALLRCLSCCECYPSKQADEWSTLARVHVVDCGPVAAAAYIPLQAGTVLTAVFQDG